ncbi:MarR family winged helix-turn-helix transcriptional regulator [Halopseudomonas pelagia]|uniref:MarR family transcriptional regulator n=1 Tax=Halopseudomonas pelagia TaxID=553151 RepID=A0AA91Z7V6_9GAMM|nr:MarR family transcriptional regulator [Halopseudomonas pelagia]PCD01165.1 MarR family transcriptional regulator [Halopseudomonas pelagia]QFY57071.1 MarR family transcriptional regulator [Halopseudomonas pelagia]
MTTPTEPQLSLHETLKPSMGAALGRVHRLWRAAINQAVGELGMTEARWAVMMHLDKMGEGCTQQVLATELAIEMPSLTRTLNQLEQQQLIERRRDKTDRRVHCLWFTEQGREQVELLAVHIAQVRKDIYQGLSDQQLDAFAEVLLSMEHNVRELLNNPEESA